MSDINSYAEDLLIKFGDSIHSELAKSLSKKFGDSWLQLGVRKHFRPNYFARVEEMLQSPLRVVDMGKQADEVHGLEHIWNIISGNWDLFGSVFHDRKRTEVYLGEIVELRNNLAHRRKRHVLLKSQLIRILGNCRMILGAMESENADSFAEAIDLLSSGGTPWGTTLEGHLPPRDEMYAEFVGRPGELGRLSEWLESDGPQILVWGYGGAGKSALAYKFARDVKDGSNQDLIAVCWVTAKRTEFVEGIIRDREADFSDLDGLIVAIWTALYGPDQIPSDLNQDRLKAELTQMPILLVVDDFDTISEDTDLNEFLLFGLRETKAKVIFTSRYRVVGIRDLEVPSFSEKELLEFVSLRSVEYGDSQMKEQCVRRLSGIRGVTGAYPLFVDNLIHHAAIVGIDKAMEDWSQRRGDAAREYALRRQIEYLGQSSGDVLIALSVANRGLIPVEVSNIAGLTDLDTEAGLAQLLRWRMVNRATEDESPSPVFRMNNNTRRLVQQTFRDDNRVRAFSAAFKALTGERVPDAKKRAIGSVIYRTKEIERTISFAEAREFLAESMTGELGDAPDLHGVLGWLYSKQSLENYGKAAREAFERSHQLGSSKVDTYFHWTTMEKNIAQWMIDNAEDVSISNEDIAKQWHECEKICELGIARCGISKLLCYWAGYASSREAKVLDRAQSFIQAQGSYARAVEWFKRALDAPVSDVAQVDNDSIFRGLALAYEGISDEDELKNTFLEWSRAFGSMPFLSFELNRLSEKFPSLKAIPNFQGILGQTNH